MISPLCSFGGRPVHAVPRRGPSRMTLRGLRAVALLVLLAAPAGARVVPAHLFLRVDRLGRGGLGAGTYEAELGQLPALTQLDGPVLLLRGLDPEEALHRGLHDAALHLLEHVESFLLVFDEGVLLAVAPEAHAFLEMVHGEEVVLPLVVHRLEHEELLEPPHELRSDLGLLVVVALFEGLPDGIAELVAGTRALLQFPEA